MTAASMTRPLVPVPFPSPTSTFFFNDTPPTEIYTLSYTLSLHDALPITTLQGQVSTLGETDTSLGNSITTLQGQVRSEEHTSGTPVTFRNLVCRLLLEKKKIKSRVHQFQVVGTHVHYGRRFVERTRAVTLSRATPFVFFFNDTATTEIYTLSYTLSLHDALPI